MNKKILIAIVLTIIILIALIASINLFKTSPTQPYTISYIVPTQNIPQRTNGIFTNLPTIVPGNGILEQEQSKLLQTRSLTTQQLESVQKLKDTLTTKPLENNDFAVTYSEDLSQFFIQLKSTVASQKLEDFLGSDPELLKLYKNDSYNLFNTSTISPRTSISRSQQEVDDYQEKKYQAQQNDANPNTLPNSPSPTQGTNPNDPSTQFKPATNILKSLMGFNLTLLPPNNPIQIPTQTEQRVVSTKSTPSNLDSLFAEAGQRVGTPPPLIKAVMAHECGVLLSETLANIQAWSQAGAGLPVTHKCFDGGVKKGDGLDLGPMQFYLPRYFEVYSQSVNQFGKYNRARPYVENIVDSIYASAYKLKLDSKSSDSDFSCLEVKRASWCYACGCSRYDNGNLNAYGCRFAPGLFQYLWGYYTIGKPTTSNAAC